MELSPQMRWRRIVARSSEGVLLKPGEMILARTYEEFAIPNGFAGRIDGRSSFGRLGLLVHCTASLVNPGWRGRVPLELVNVSASPMRITPLIPICQLLVITLTSKAARPYGAPALSSKYMNDDGGPSYWWRDKRIQALQGVLGTQEVAIDIQEGILKTVGDLHVDIVARLEDFIASTPRSELTNSDEILDSFALSETRRRWLRMVGRDSLIACAPVLIACSLGSLFSQPFGSTIYGWIHYSLWLVTALSVPVSIFACRSDLGEFLTVSDLGRLQRGVARSEK
jgi:dUTPase